MADTTTNQKWADAEEKRMEKKDAREQEQDANALCLQARRETDGKVAHH
jgi:hypothetical protein